VPAKIRNAVSKVLDELDRGRLRVAEKVNGTWFTHQWIKKAILLSFRIQGSRPMRAGSLQFYDKVGRNSNATTASGSSAAGSASCLLLLRATAPLSRKT